MSKLLREKYKTADGAHKRAAFENGVAESEYRYGMRAHVYRFRVEFEDGAYRVARYTPQEYAKQFKRD